MNKPDNVDPVSDAAFGRRVAGYLDGDLDGPDLRMLNAELLADSAKRVVFIRSCMVRAALIRDGAAERIAGSISILGVEDDFSAIRAAKQMVGPAESVQPMDETMILPAIRDDGPDAGRGPEAEWFAVAPTAETAGLKNRAGVGLRRWGAAAAVLLVASGIAYSLWPARPAIKVADRPVTATTNPVAPAPAVSVTAVAGAEASGSLRPGLFLTDGQSFQLDFGGAELTFSSGATVVLRAPSRIRVVDRNAIILDSGSLYAHVPKEAIGFMVSAPGLRVVDHGTNFGVLTSDSGKSSATHVFDGLVDAAALDDQGRQVGLATPVSAGQAVTHSRASVETVVRPIPFDPVAFDRDIARIRIPVLAHGTGDGVTAGSPDPNWELVAVSCQPNWKPRAASVVVDPRTEYSANSADSKWVSTTPIMESAPAADYTYRTTVDLTGFNPATVSVNATLSADDGVTAIIVNGKSCPMPDAILNLSATDWRKASHSLAITNVDWVAGINRIDVVVLNAPPVGGGPNYTGLKLGWTVTGSLGVRR